MDTPLSGSSGLLGSLRGFADGLLDSVQDRLELISIELQEEKHRLVQILIWIASIIVTGLLALVFASLALVVWLWDTARVAAIGGLALAYATGLAAIIFCFHRYLARQPRPFDATLGELKQDRQCIRPETSND